MWIVLAGATDGERENGYDCCEAMTANHVRFGERRAGEDADCSAIETSTAIDKITAPARLQFNLNIYLSAIADFQWLARRTGLPDRLPVTRPTSNTSCPLTQTISIPNEGR
jgi:hypothetical protein